MTGPVYALSFSSMQLHQQENSRITVTSAVFLQHAAKLALQAAVYATAYPSVRPSVRLSKRGNAEGCRLNRWVAQWLLFSDAKNG